MPGGVATFAYDGSDCARRALEQGAERLAPERAEVVTVWWPYDSIAGAARAALPGEVVHEAVGTLDREGEERARATADEGAAVLRERGIDAVARTQRASPNAWSAVLAAADEADADVIVVGSRGVSALRAALLGSTSLGVVQHSTRPVLIGR